MEGNLPRKDEPRDPDQPRAPAQPPNPIQPLEHAEAPQNPPAIQVVQSECLLSTKKMFDQLVSNLKQEQPIAQVVAAPSRAPIEKLPQHRAYKFFGTIEEKPEEDEYYWWETTTLTAPAEKITWKFFVKVFKKKYISEQYLNDRRNRFLHLKQANKPIEQYGVEFCKYCKYGSEYIKTEKDKCRKFTDGLNDVLGPMFTAMEIKDFQILVNRAIATKAKMKVIERRKGGSRSDNRKQKRDDRSHGSYKKAKHHYGGSSSY
ncbi:hypothetical protein V6N11_021627 [Hibiscus sabdariffa]|uniref:Retrotransposon gag domain-containing protein n=1 Tax=Hibiscus sabdariffa TaxID=183260 RepID=A0ABR2PBQ0_9ROSI